MVLDNVRAVGVQVSQREPPNQEVICTSYGCCWFCLNSVQNGGHVNGGRKGYEEIIIVANRWYCQYRYIIWPGLVLPVLVAVDHVRN